MKKLVLVVFAALFFSTRLYSQTDTSSYFPLGFWGLWVDKTAPPFSRALSPAEWDKEYNNWRATNGNYLVYWIPNSVESNVMSFADQNNYRMDIANYDYVAHYADSPNSLIGWLWRENYSDTASAITYINSLKTQYASHTGFYSYSFGQETPVSDQRYWPGVEFLARKIHELDPARKSYMVSPGAPPQGFVDATPDLDILQVDAYFFDPSYGQNYNDQQTVLDTYVSHFNATMDRLRDKHTEWHAVIQTQREYLNSQSGEIHRRPNIYEIKVQAYLALSRGAKGITSYIYGSSPFPPPGNSPSQLLTSTRTFQVEDILVSHGLVDLSRDPFIARTDAEGIDAFANVAAVYNELRQLGPTIRKLKVYDAFPSTSIPVGNAASITSVSGNKIEIGTFKRVDTGTDSTIHFMLVNRVCNNPDGTVSSPQSVTVTFNRPSGSWRIEDVVSHSSWIIASNGSFTDNLGPGQGKLYKLTLAPPPAPVLVSPSNSATNVSTSPTLSWNASSGATSYQLQVSTSSSFSTTIVNQSGITATSYAVSGIAYSTTYYWHVNATNAGGTSAWSTTWSFTTVPPPPSPPTLLSPSNGATGVSASPTLSWNASSGATSYGLQVSTSSSFSTTIVNQTGLATTSYAVSGLGNNTTYYWHVNVSNPGGTSAWSSTWSFTTVVQQYYLTVNSPCGLPTTGQGWYNAGTQVQVTVTSPYVSGATRWTFTTWSGNASGNQNPIPITMDGSKTIITTIQHAQACPKTCRIQGKEASDEEVADTLFAPLLRVLAEQRILLAERAGA